MITFIAVMVVVNFILLCTNEYGSLKRDQASANMMITLGDALDRIEGKVDSLEQKIATLEEN